jgi:UDP-N-acetylmuramate dehydrogenase
VRLSELTTLRLGGPAAALVEARSETELLAAVRGVRGPLLLLAGGSNLVVADEGFPGTVLRVLTAGVEERERDDGRVELTAQAGEPWEPFVARCVAAGLAGVESLSGIPGSIGATPIQNVGAYGQEVAETVVSVRVFDRERDVVEELPPADCGFAYRSSRFKREPGRWVVLRVGFALDPQPHSAPVRYPELARALGIGLDETAPLADVRGAVLGLRRAKGMVIDPADPDSVSAGSFFTNPVLDPDSAARLPEDAPRWTQADGTVKCSAAWLIERSGFGRGYGSTRAALSDKHTLALTNRGGAGSEDLLDLAAEIQRGVHETYGVWLVIEPVLVGCALPVPEGSAG